MLMKNLGVPLGFASVSMLGVIALLTYTTAPKADGVFQKYCIDGVSYLHFANGPMIQKDQQGNVVTCNVPNPPQQGAKFYGKGK